MLAWPQDWKIGLIHIQPGRPLLSSHVDSFLDRLREECRNMSWFCALYDVRCTLSPKREEYNCELPHGTVDYRPPQGLILAFEGKRATIRLTLPATNINPNVNLQL